MDKLSAIFAALRAGSALTDSTNWQQRQTRINVLSAAISALIGMLALYGFRIEISSEDITMLASGIGVAYGLLNSYFTTATNKQLGMPDKSAAAKREPFPEIEP